jgi:LmbE family N-acetylglucosaminyl deacetylase
VGRGSRATGGAVGISPRPTTVLLILALLLLPAALQSQERGAAALSETVDGLGVTTRVLMIGAHPDDEDTNLLAWLAKGQHVETAYLSLTRGDGGQNLIGNELGEALGAIRTEELLAARRVDGAHQFFTRAYDFGFSKTAEETYLHWPHDTLLGDVVRVVRTFRPHVIVAVFSGTPRDGHGHHQVSGMLAREVYELAGDTTRYPRDRFGVPWTPLKFYRSSRSNRADATLAVNVGQYDPVLGRSYAEIAGESRSQHKSQGFGVLEPKGPVTGYLRREATRVNATEAASAERSLFDGIDTGWTRFDDVREPTARAALAEIPRAIDRVRAAFDMHRPEAMLPSLARLHALLTGACPEYQTGRTSACATVEPHTNGAGLVRHTTHPDLERSLDVVDRRVSAAMQLAAGIVLEAETPREVVPVGAERLPMVVRLHNRGTATVAASGISVQAGARSPTPLVSRTRIIGPGTTWVDTVSFDADSITQPWWLAQPRRGDMFVQPPGESEDRLSITGASVSLVNQIEGDSTRGVTFGVTAPVVRRYADPVLGEVNVPVAAAPAISVTLGQSIEIVPANSDVRRSVAVHLRSADTAQRSVVVRLELPRGLTADSASRTVTLDGYDARAIVTFQLRGRMAPGLDSVRVTAESGGQTFTDGYDPLDYQHIRPRRLYRPATLALQAVDVRVPVALDVAYIPGVGDNVAPVLHQLGIPVTVIDPAALASADLSRYGAVVVGPRAYQAWPAVMAARGKLLDYARAGGTLVVQYQQTEIQAPGVAPYPMTFVRPADRVTIEEAPVTIVDPAARVLTGPNHIGQADFAGWVQERSTYMPRTFDERYSAPLEMHDPGEEPNRGALLVAPIGKGTYVYVTLSLFRQLPAAVPGAARLFVNMLSAGGASAAAVVP